MNSSAARNDRAEFERDEDQENLLVCVRWVVR